MLIMYLFIKRVADFLLALLLIILLLPFLLPVMILLRLTAEGDVFYRQERVGIGIRPFYIWKFVTMVRNSPNIGTGSLTLRNDPRVTPVGKYLRKSKVNELPQLINVLTGDMSFVGPRPQMSVDFKAYTPDVQVAIGRLKPGITGLGSIVFRDEEKLISAASVAPRDYYVNVIAPHKGALEVWYLRNRSLWVDFKILFLTARVILFPEAPVPVSWFPGIPEFEQSAAA